MPSDVPGASQLGAWLKGRRVSMAGLLLWRRGSTASTTTNTSTPGVSEKGDPKCGLQETRTGTASASSQREFSGRRMSAPAARAQERERSVAAEKGRVSRSCSTQGAINLGDATMPGARGTTRAEGRAPSQGAAVDQKGDPRKRSSSSRKPREMLPLTPRPAPQLKNLSASPLWERRQKVKPIIWDVEDDSHASSGSRSRRTSSVDTRDWVTGSSASSNSVSPSGRTTCSTCSTRVSDYGAPETQKFIAGEKAACVERSSGLPVVRREQKNSCFSLCLGT
mmetsp:Transcript_56146/g.149848  ORF Transcript_56146/g.149848 Transcript_56146/m.149848 type:complete len:280 (-) Transcript_56146:416-1255(-)